MTAKRPRRLDYMRLADIAPAEKNPKAHAAEVIAGSISRFGYIEAIHLDERTLTVVAGHGRRDDLIRRRDAGEEPPDGIVAAPDGEWLVPVVRGWRSRDDADALAAGITLNRAGEVGGWHAQDLEPALRELEQLEVGLEEVGWPRADLDRLTAELAPPSEPPAQDREVLAGNAEYRCPNCRHEWSGSPKPRPKRPPKAGHG